MEVAPIIAQQMIYIIRNFIDEKLTQETVTSLKMCFDVGGHAELERATIRELNKHYKSIIWTSGIGFLAVWYA